MSDKNIRLNNKKIKIAIWIVLVIVTFACGWYGASHKDGEDDNQNNYITEVIDESNDYSTELINNNTTSDNDDISETDWNTTVTDEVVPPKCFRNEHLREEHYEKHGVEMGFASAEEYELAAARVVANDKSLHKIEAEDGDDVYYLESTNEFVIVSTDGYIRTYFCPSDGKKYFDRQQEAAVHGGTVPTCTIELNCSMDVYEAIREYLALVAFFINIVFTVPLYTSIMY